MPKESPKLISDTFEAHLAKLAKKKEEQNFEKMIQPLLNSPKKPQFSPKLETLLKNFNKNDVEKILCLFAFLTKQYGDAFIDKFGQEPDKPFCDVVSKLSQQEIERLKENVSDRLARGSTRIPSHGDLQNLAQRPTTAEIEKAIINIFDKPLTPNHLNRVEAYVSKTYYKNFNRNAKSFYKEFEKVYVDAWRSVMLHDVDKNTKPNINIESLPLAPGDTFDDHLAKVGNVAKRLKPHKAHTQTRSNISYDTGNFTSKVQMMFEAYSEEEVKKILLFWEMMLKAYGYGMRLTYGEEPDSSFCALAISLTEEQMMRVADNVHDALIRDKNFAPAHEHLRMLSQRPTRREIVDAMDDLYYRPKPIKELSRVNAYIRKYHQSKISALKMEFFKSAFEDLYVHFWREVTIFNVDKRTEAEQAAVKESIKQTEATANDKKVEADIENGNAFNHKLGSRIARLLAEKHASK